MEQNSEIDICDPSIDACVDESSGGVCVGDDCINDRRQSKIEEIAEKFQKRFDERIVVTMDVRKRFLNHCRNVASKLNYHHNRIPINEIQEFRDSVAKEKDCFALFVALGFRDNKKVLLSVLDKAIDVCSDLNTDKIHYRDFSFDYTVLEWKLPLLRIYFFRLLFIVFLLYSLTAVTFCSLKINGVCISTRPILSAMYFTSATISTVGYGDTSVDQDNGNPGDWEILLGTIYMIVAVCVGVTVVRAGFQSIFTPFLTASERLISYLAIEQKNDFLYIKIRRVRCIKYLCIFLQFFFLNFIGVVLSRFLFKNNWSWAKSIYWAVQTTTTIGYGDFGDFDDMDLNMLWFQIFYLLISTFFVGDAIRKFVDLEDEIQHIRRVWAFERREVSRDMIEEFQANDNDGKIDQYEFIVTSLLLLGKISPNDLNLIMDRFRALAGDDDVIDDEDIIDDSVHKNVEHIYDDIHPIS